MPTQDRPSFCLVVVVVVVPANMGVPSAVAGVLPPELAREPVQVSAEE